MASPWIRDIEVKVGGTYKLSFTNPSSGNSPALTEHKVRNDPARCQWKCVPAEIVAIPASRTITFCESCGSR